MLRMSLILMTIAAPAVAQESGWHYSPYPGEGDRATMGCAYDSSPTSHACVVVRCDDDYSVGLYIETSRMGGDAGRWEIHIDDADSVVSAVPIGGVPYGARVEGDVAPLIDGLKNGGSLYLDPLDGAALPRNGIGLSGSLMAINQALYFCAPRVDPEAKTEDTSSAQ